MTTSILRDDDALDAAHDALQSALGNLGMLDLAAALMLLQTEAEGFSSGELACTLNGFAATAIHAFEDGDAVIAAMAALGMVAEIRHTSLWRTSPEAGPIVALLQAHRDRRPDILRFAGL